MLGKVPKLKYVDHDVTDNSKFLNFVQEAYLENRGEVGPLLKYFGSCTVDHMSLQLRHCEYVGHTTFWSW
jgi:hypothetical protein